MFDSKLGGTPYLPDGFDYPRSRSSYATGTPLKLLAQLNLEQLPPLPDFPTRGMLQFYIEPEDQYGCDFKNPTNTESFRVIYHSEIQYDESRLQSPPVFNPEGEDCFPLEGEFRLVPKLVEQMMTPNDYRFDACFAAVYQRHFPGTLNSALDLPEEEYDTIHEACSAGGTQLGGYPFFTQEDPRDLQGSLSQHTMLLFQCDTDYDQGICWGDGGVANFFIAPAQLRNLDFSNVAYNWDCY